MSGAQLISSPSIHVRDDSCRDHVTPLWSRVLTLEGSILAKLGVALLAAGALLAYSPIHPGLLCPMRATTGVPCPFCGMTTSVKACLRMDFGAALAANPGGILAVGLAAGLIALRPSKVKVPVAFIVAAASVMWVWQLFRFSVL